jgi:serine phosphatase RsbU (regulator of sigma subunit)
MIDPTTQRLEAELARERANSRRLRAVADTASLVNSTLDLRELADHIIDAATRLIGAERGSLFLVDSDAGRLTSLVAQGLETRSLSLPIGEGIVGAVAASGEAVILNQPYDDARFDPSVDRATGFRTRSLMTVPVRDRDGDLTAVLQLLNHDDGGFSDEDVAFLAELGVPFAVALTTARLHAEIVVRERMREELRLAAEIQRALQPEPGVHVPGLELSTLLRPCLEVGGDYWDLIPSDDDDRWWVIVADISGKGVSAGLIASNVQAYFWSRRGDRRSLGRVVAEGNELLYRLAQGRKFATLVIAEWRPHERRLVWVNAGHPPVFVRTGGRVIDLEATGRPIGMLPDQDYEVGELVLAPGDAVLLYTDGVFEAGTGGPEGEFGLDRIRACLEGGVGCEVVTDRLRDAVRGHLGKAAPDDDITIVCLECSDTDQGE